MVLDYGWNITAVFRNTQRFLLSTCDKGCLLRQRKSLDALWGGSVWQLGATFPKQTNKTRINMDPNRKNPFFKNVKFLQLSNGYSEGGAYFLGFAQNFASF